ncbi:MAG: capsule assembly Wzi family protein, partial [Treponema sp.]|nr:capsule assembly Wzi family protein [Treponema sp.]
MKRFWVAFTFFVVVSALEAQGIRPYFSMISAGDPVLEDLRFLIIQSGKSFLSLTPPLSRDEVLLIMRDIDTDTLSDGGEAAYNRITNALNPKPLYSNEFFSADAHIKAGIEARVRTNPVVSWTQNVADSPALLALPVNLYIADRVQLFIEPSFAQSRWYYDEPGTYFGTNTPPPPDALKRFDANMPLRAFLAAGGPWWNFEIGRDRLSYGLGRTGNMALSDTPDYYDMARLSLFSSVFKYSVLISQMPLTVSDGIAPDFSGLNETAVKTTTQRYFYAHRFDVRLFRRISIGLTEGIMVGNSPLEARFLNPMAIFHAFAAWRDYDGWEGTDNPDHADMVGSLFSLDLNWAIMSGLSLYGQFVMNEWAIPSEMEGWPENVVPNATGFLAGLEYTRDFRGWAASFYAECMYSDPYLYILSTPFASYIWMRRVFDSSSDSEALRYRWIGHPEGRDTVMYTVGSSFSRENLGCFLNVSFVQKGDHTIQWDWNMGRGYTDQKTPSGIPENNLRLALGANWKPFGWLELSAQTGGSIIFNHGHTSGTQEYGLDAILSIRFIY